MLILSFSVALLIQISKDEKWLIYLLRVTGCPNHGTWTKSCKAMDPSTDLIIYVIYFKMFRFFSLPRSLFGKIFFFILQGFDERNAPREGYSRIAFLWVLREKKKTKKMRGFWLDASFSSHVKKVISAIWLALVFFDRLGNGSLFRAFSAWKS